MSSSQKKSILEKRLNNTQDKLEKFRLKNKVLNPIEEGEEIMETVRVVKNKIYELQSENIRLFVY